MIKKIIGVLFCLLINSVVYAGNVVIYDPFDVSVSSRVTDYLTSVNTPDYVGDDYTLIDPDLSAVSAVDKKYWKYLDGSIVEMIQAEKDLMDIEWMSRVTKYQVDAATTTDAGVYEELFSFSEYFYAGTYTIKSFAEVTGTNKLGWQIKIDDVIIREDVKIKPEDDTDYLPMVSVFSYDIATSTNVTYSIYLSGLSVGQEARIKNIVIEVKPENE